MKNATSISISRDPYAIKPTARIAIILPGDAQDPDIADYSAELTRALRNAFKAAIDSPCCEEYAAETGCDGEDDLDVSDAVREILLDQLRRLDGISCDITAQVDARQMTTTVDAMHSLTQSMCALAEALRV